MTLPQPVPVLEEDPGLFGADFPIPPCEKAPLHDDELGLRVLLEHPERLARPRRRRRWADAA